jgi:hypothetical protein
MSNEEYARIGRMTVDLVMATLATLGKDKPAEPIPNARIELDVAGWIEAYLQKKGPIRLSSLGAHMPRDMLNNLYDRDWRLKEYVLSYDNLFVVTNSQPGLEVVSLVGQDVPAEPEKRVCKFYNTEKGCKFGDKCRSEHSKQ